MNITAAICEFNPFHNGHQIMLGRMKELDKDAVLVAVVSGSTVQRGELAIYPKYDRARAAVECGADLVLELPCPFSCSSAEFFAAGAVELIGRLGIECSLVFGSEGGDIAELSRVADNMLSEKYKNALSSPSKDGSYCFDAEKTYKALFGSGFPKQPNSILGVEYIKAIKNGGYNIVPKTYKREDGFSAGNTRSMILRGDSFEDQVPIPACRIFSQLMPTDRKVYSDLALYTLRSAPDAELSRFFGMNGGVSGLLKNLAPTVCEFDSLVSLATSKKYTSSRIKRSVLSAILGITEDDVRQKPLYTNLLAASEKGRALLSQIRKSSEIPVITRQCDAKKLSPEAKEQYLIGQRADSLLCLCRGQAPSESFKTAPYIELVNNNAVKSENY